MRHWNPPNKSYDIKPIRPDRNTVLDLDRFKTWLKIGGRSYGKMAMMGLGGIGVSELMPGPRYLSPETRVAIMKTISAVRELNRQREAFEQSSNVWARAFRRVDPLVRHAWLHALNVEQRNQVARAMGVNPHPSKDVTIGCIMRKMNAWLPPQQHGKEAAVETYAEKVEKAFDQMSADRAEGILLPFFKDQHALWAMNYDKRVAMGVWAETGEGEARDPRPVFCSGMGAFVRAMTEDADFGKRFAAFVYSWPNRTAATQAHVSFLAAWKAISDNEQLSPGCGAQTMHSVGAAINGRMKEYHGEIRSYVEEIVDDYHSALPQAVRDELFDAVHDAPRDALLYMAIRLVVGDEVAGVLRTAVKDPVAARDVATNAQITPRCFAGECFAGECEETACPIGSTCADWTRWAKTVRDSTYYRTILATDAERRELAKAALKPGVILCGEGCPYLRVLAPSTILGFDRSNGIWGCALDSVRGVDPEPRYWDSRCRFELTPGEMGFGYERVTDTAGHRHERPVGGPVGELAKHIASLQESLSHGKKY